MPFSPHRRCSFRMSLPSTYLRYILNLTRLLGNNVGLREANKVLALAHTVLELSAKIINVVAVIFIAEIIVVLMLVAPSTGLLAVGVDVGTRRRGTLMLPL